MFSLVPGQFIRPRKLEVTLCPWTAVWLLPSVSAHVGLGKHEIDLSMLLIREKIPLNVTILCIFFHSQSVDKGTLFSQLLRREIVVS